MNRLANYELVTFYRKMLQRGCPQGSQLMPKLWKVAITPIYSSVNVAKSKIITYADDILLVTCNENNVFESMNDFYILYWFTLNTNYYALHIII